MASGSIGTGGSNTDIISSPVSLNCTMPTATYPNGTITFNDIKAGGAYWTNTYSGVSGAMDVYICDSAGNNAIKLFNISLGGGGSNTTTKSATISGANGLAGKALYIKGVQTSGSGLIKLRNATSVTINTTVLNYTLTVAKGTGVASVSGGGSKAYGSSNAISATMNTGYSFKNWTSNNGGTFANANSASTNFTMPAGNVTVTANGQINSYTLTTAVSPSGYGTVTTGATLNYGATKSLTATPGTGRYFSSWSKTAGTLSSTTSNPTTFTMGAGNATVTANFGTNSYTLTVAKGTGIASVTGGGSKAYGSSNAITATASTGYSFKNWTSNNGGTFTNASSSSTNFTMPAGNVTVTANAQINSYTLTVAKGAGIASVTGGGTKNYASSNAITATVSNGYSFKNWTSNNGGTFANANSSSTNFTMPAGNVTVTANAQANSYTLTVVAGTGISAVTGGGSKAYTSSNTITATVIEGYTFAGWTSNNGGTFANANSSTTTFTMPAGDVTVTATAISNAHILTTVANPINSGTVTPGEVLQYNTTKSLTATPIDGYVFSSWSTTSGTLSSTTSNPTTFTMGDSDATVTANFILDTTLYNLTSSVNPSDTGTVTLGAASGMYKAQIAIDATPNNGYRFVGWSASAGKIENVHSTSTKIIMPASNTAVTAYFIPITTSSGRYNGTSYDKITPYYYNGSFWVECEIQRYNGSSWISVNIQ